MNRIGADTRAVNSLRQRDREQRICQFRATVGLTRIKRFLATQVVEINADGYKSRKKVGGGCSVVDGSADAGLLVLMILGLAGLLRRRFVAA